MNILEIIFWMMMLCIIYFLWTFEDEWFSRFIQREYDSDNCYNKKSNKKDGLSFEFKEISSLDSAFNKVWSYDIRITNLKKRQVKIKYYASGLFDNSECIFYEYCKLNKNQMIWLLNEMEVNDGNRSENNK